MTLAEIAIELKEIEREVDEARALIIRKLSEAGAQQPHDSRTEARWIGFPKERTG